MPTLAFAIAAVAVVVTVTYFNRRPEAAPAAPVSAQAETPPAKPADSAETPTPKSVATERTSPPAPVSAALTNASSRANPKPAPSAKPVSGEVVRGEVIQQVQPEVSGKARATIQGRVRVSVKLQVDASGNVTSADLESSGPSKYFAELSQRTARQWKFSPATIAGQNSPSQWLLRFEFTSSGTTIRPVAQSP